MEAILIPVNIISDIKEKNVYVENYVYRLTTERFSDVISAVEQMLFMTLEQRIITFLLDETARTGGDTVHMTQEKLAQAIGSAREAVTRTLKQLSSAGGNRSLPRRHQNPQTTKLSMKSYPDNESSFLCH